MNHSEIKNAVKSIIGLKCSMATINHVGKLNVLIGKLTEKSQKNRRNTFHGEYEIRTYSACWRILRNTEILTGFYDAEASVNSVLKTLVDARITKVDFGSSVLDLHITFDNSITIEIFGNSAKDYSWELKTPNGFIEAHASNQLIKVDPDFIDELTPSEKEMSIHAEACSKRWELVTPASAKEKTCKECIYYRPLEGEFYFWDYGLCSNPLSAVDGKVVNVCSSCDNFSYEL
jgi:hypothetical protein